MKCCRSHFVTDSEIPVPALRRQAAYGRDSHTIHWHAPRSPIERSGTTPTGAGLPPLLPLVRQLETE